MDKIQAKNMLNDVVKHFSKNPKELRSISICNSCLYMPPESKPKSIGCAIGMYLPNKVARQLDRSDDTDIVTVFNDYLTLLPKWMQKMDVSFLNSLQRLHDINSNWDEKGLSKSGKEEVKDIIKEYNL